MEKDTHSQQAERAELSGMESPLSLSADAANGLPTQTDNRPEAVAQRKLQEAANASPQAMQLKALQRNVGKGVVQRKPSDMQKIFGEDPAFKMSFMDKAKNINWNRYIAPIKTYMAIGDGDQAKKVQSFPAAYAAIAFFKSHTGSFTEDQLDLGKKVNWMLEAEKVELFNGAAGMMDTSTEDIGPAFPDPVIAEDPGAKHDPAAIPLFAHKPTIEDVRQGGLGDCFFMAAVASLVNKDPEHFQRHMSDHFDGKVTVKFYTMEGAPVLITVNKTVAGERYARGTLWVKLLEKAYAASGLKQKKVEPDKTRSYHYMAAGDSNHAFRHLTGKASKHFALGRGKMEFRDEIPAELARVGTEFMTRMQLIESERREALKTHAADSEEVKEIEARQVSVMEQMVAAQAPLQEMERALSFVYFSRENLAAIRAKHSENEEFLALLDRLVPNADEFLPGALGTGRYGKDEEDAYAYITDLLVKGKAITAGTKGSIEDDDNKAEAVKGSAGEAKVGGLAGSHAYTVLGAKEDGGQKWIQVRNPWGVYGRKYEDKVGGGVKGVADAESNGTFWMDLADFTAYFEDVCSGG